MNGHPAFLFDLDDTLIDFTGSGRRCWQQVCAAYAPRFPDITPDLLLETVLLRSQEYWSDPQRHKWGRMNISAARRQIVREALLGLNIDPVELGDPMADEFTTRRDEWVTLYPGALDTLSALQQKGFRLGLVTNGLSGSQRQKIERFGLAPYFDLIQIEEEFGVGKPEAQVFHHVLGLLESSPERAWMVGDDLYFDLATPAGLGMTTVWVNPAGKSLPSGAAFQPTFVISEPVEVRELIRHTGNP